MTNNKPIDLVDFISKRDFGIDNLNNLATLMSRFEELIEMVMKHEFSYKELSLITSYSMIIAQANNNKKNKPMAKVVGPYVQAMSLGFVMGLLSTKGELDEL